MDSIIFDWLDDYSHWKRCMDDMESCNKDCKSCINFTMSDSIDLIEAAKDILMDISTKGDDGK